MLRNGAPMSLTVPSILACDFQMSYAPPRVPITRQGNVVFMGPTMDSTTSTKVEVQIYLARQF